VLALRFDRGEGARGGRLVGLVVGLLGVVALVGIDLTGDRSELLGAGALLLAALGYAAAPLLILKRHLADLDPRVQMGISLLIAAVLLAPAAAIDHPSETPPAAAIIALVVLGLVCTAGGLTLFSMLNAEIGPGRAVVITYVNPLVALTLGMLFLDERPGAGSLLGLAMILTGCWLATRPPRDAGAPVGTEVPVRLADEVGAV
jgi:drug/metabolite transporter (DMT)-like permease